jgi:O-antigen/teichoic acid export membrane protein
MSDHAETGSGGHQVRRGVGSSSASGGSSGSGAAGGSVEERAGANAAGAVARGGALNMAGSIIYGVANFGLLVVLDRTLGVRSAGIVLVAIAIFNITSTVAELGCSTGLIRMISRDRAIGHQERIRATLIVGIAPVAVLSTLFAGTLFLLAHPFAQLLAEGSKVDVVADVLRGMAIFLPFSALHSVIIQGTRGFDTMLPQVAIERVGRALTLPLVVATAVAVGMGPLGVGVSWAATNLLALLFSGWWIVQRTHKATLRSGKDPVPADATMARAFWAFTAPRAVGNASEVAVSWIDTVLIGALVSTTAAGIYASGTRYLLPGVYAGEALMQVTGPRISGLLAKGEREEASALLKIVAGWQTSVMWPLYLLTALFARPLLRVFGPEAVQARGALVALAIAMLITAPAGPVASVILMSGRSRQAMVNTLCLVGVNLGGNLIFVPKYGITAAGFVWGATILVAALLPGWQSARSLHVATLGRPAAVAAAMSAATVGVVGLVVRQTVGETPLGLILASSVGALAYLVGLRLLRSQLHLDTLWNGIRRRS